MACIRMRLRPRKFREEKGREGREGEEEESGNTLLHSTCSRLQVVMVTWTADSCNCCASSEHSPSKLVTNPSSLLPCPPPPSPPSRAGARKVRIFGRC